MAGGSAGLVLPEDVDHALPVLRAWLLRRNGAEQLRVMAALLAASSVPTHAQAGHA